jgi:hypothetical protein
MDDSAGGPGRRPDDGNAIFTVAVFSPGGDLATKSHCPKGTEKRTRSPMNLAAGYKASESCRTHVLRECATAVKACRQRRQTQPFATFNEPTLEWECFWNLCH